jgi:hypothetical protein
MGVPSVLIGLWAGFAPRGFYHDFPGAGRSWVAPDGPFNEHLVRDVGVLNLALAVVTIAAAAWLTRPLVRATAWAWLAYSVPQLVYHLLHRGVLDPSDQVAASRASPWSRCSRSYLQSRPACERLRVRRRDRAGGVIHEYRLMA